MALRLSTIVKNARAALSSTPVDPAWAADAVTRAIEEHHAADPEGAMRKAARAKVEAQSWGLTYEQATKNAMELIQGL